MSNPANTPQIYIQAKDNTGETRNLTVKGWHELTGKSQESVRNAYRKNKRGDRKLTNREIVGCDDVDYITRDRQKAARKKEILTEKDLLMREFTRRRLV